MIRNITALVILISSLYRCYNPGPYSYDRYYVPLEEEKRYKEAITPPYAEVKRQPDQYKDKLIAWFGVVKKIEDRNGKTVIYLSHRIHIKRHLCADETRASCRVTVSEKSRGDFIAYVKLKDKDRRGPNSVQPLSLLRIIGRFKGEFDPKGDPILEAVYYRHWPKGQYVTTKMRRYFRR